MTSGVDVIQHSVISYHTTWYVLNIGHGSVMISYRGSNCVKISGNRTSPLVKAKGKLKGPIVLAVLGWLQGLSFSDKMETKALLSIKSAQESAKNLKISEVVSTLPHLIWGLLISIS